MEPKEPSTYMVWATSKADAIAKATALVTEKGQKVTSAFAEKFPEGVSYRVNWKVLLYLESAD